MAFHLAMSRATVPLAAAITAMIVWIWIINKNDR